MASARRLGVLIVGGGLGLGGRASAAGSLGGAAGASPDGISPLSFFSSDAAERDGQTRR